MVKPGQVREDAIEPSWYFAELRYSYLSTDFEDCFRHRAQKLSSTSLRCLGQVTVCAT